jgi:hypothetical protein
MGGGNDNANTSKNNNADNESIDAFVKIRDPLDMILSKLDAKSIGALTRTSVFFASKVPSPSTRNKASMLKNHMISLINALMSLVANETFMYRIGASLMISEGTAILFNIAVLHKSLYFVCDHHQAVDAKDISEYAKSNLAETHYNYHFDEMNVVNPMVGADGQYHYEFYTEISNDEDDEDDEVVTPNTRPNIEPIVHMVELMSKELEHTVYDACIRAKEQGANLQSILASITFISHSSISNPQQLSVTSIDTLRDNLLHFVNEVTTESKLRVTAAYNSINRSSVLQAEPSHSIVETPVANIMHSCDMVLSSSTISGHMKIPDAQLRNATIMNAIKGCHYVDRIRKWNPITQIPRHGGYSKKQTKYKSNTLLHNTGQSVTSNNVTRTVFLQGNKKCVKYKHQVLSVTEFKKQTRPEKKYKK